MVWETTQWSYPCTELIPIPGINRISNNRRMQSRLETIEAIAAAVIGGCLLTGGRGSLIGALLGTFIVVSVRYELIALGAPSSWYMTFVGAVLIAAVVMRAPGWLSSMAASACSCSISSSRKPSRPLASLST